MPLRIGLIGAFPNVDSGGSTGGGTNPVVILTTNLPAATLGLPYQATLEAKGGIPPYIWSLIGGSLPPGLDLDSFGDITGIPSGLGTFNFTVQAVDPDGNTGRADGSFQI